MCNKQTRIKKAHSTVLVLPFFHKFPHESKHEDVSRQRPQREAQPASLVLTQNARPTTALSAHRACRACQVCVHVGERKVNKSDRPRDRRQCLHRQQVDKEVEKGGYRGYTPPPRPAVLL